MRIKIEMTTVDGCQATACAYNVDQKCHARAITIGDSTHPACDTYLSADDADDRAQRAEPAGVGACKVEACRYNSSLECEAPAIEVASHAMHADCVTYQPR